MQGFLILLHYLTLLLVQTRPKIYTLKCTGGQSLKLELVGNKLASNFPMTKIMTFFADWHNIKPMFQFVSVPMVVLLGGLRTVMTQFSIGSGQLTVSYSVIYSILCLAVLGMAVTSIFVLLALFISFFSNLTFFCFSIFSLIFQMASLAFGFKIVFISKVFVKFRKSFCLFANSAGFCFNWFSHNVLSLQKNVLVRADRIPIILLGSFYSNIVLSKSQ